MNAVDLSSAARPDSELRPSLDELTTVVDPDLTARVWRELGLAALGQLHQATVEIDRLRQRLADSLDDRRRRPAA